MKVEEYILETPGKMSEVFTKSELIFSEVRKDSFDKLIITGSGTSYHSALQTKPFLQDLLNIEVEALYPFQITEALFEGDNHNTLLIGLSQGGSSYSTYNAMLTAKNKGVTVGSMAGKEEALIDEVSDYIMTVYCGPENAGPKTKGFTTTKLNLMLFGLHVAAERGLITESMFEEEVDQLEAAIQKFEEIYHSSVEWVKANQDVLAKAPDIRVIGTEDLYGDVLESALKMLETLRIPITGYEFEEFIHGIYNAINEESTLIIYDSGKEGRLNKLIEVLSGWTENVYVITNQGKTEDHKSLYLPINGKNPYEKLFFITPVQLICAFVPELKGVDPSTPKDPEFHKKLNSKKL
jgi:glucosamine 6-phosphate synthetase-like amidotransferase/phosphosugar isomerase protein